MVDVVVCKTIAFVIIGVKTVVKNCNTTVRSKPEVARCILQNRVYNSSFLMVVTYIKKSFFCVFNSDCIMRSNTKPEGSALVLAYFIYRRIFDFCDSGKAFKLSCRINKQIIFDCSRNPDTTGSIAVKARNLNCVLSKLVQTFRNFYFSFRCKVTEAGCSSQPDVVIKIFADCAD